MIYRIDIQHFLSHAVDYFTAEELTHCQYAIISAVIQNGSRELNIAKINTLYPLPEIVIEYDEYKNKDMMEKMYMDYLCPKDSNDVGLEKRQMNNIFYDVFINNLINHRDIVILCDRTENDYIDVICKVLKKEYEIEVIDLNELFSKGSIGPIYIDRDKIWDNAVDIRRESARDRLRSLESSPEGRMALLGMMNKKKKIAKIKELGFTITSYDQEDLDRILLDGWVNTEDE